MTGICEIHLTHSPKRLTSERHHVIPRAWQMLWHPADDQRILWAPRTIELCPTGHRNVHEILVKVMKSFETVVTFPDEPRRLERAITIVRADYGRQKEFEIAVMAPRQWLTKGGMLGDLTSQKQYGYGIATLPVPGPVGGFATGGVIPKSRFSR